MPLRRFPVLATGALALFVESVALADQPAFESVGTAFLEKHCVACHGAKKQKANLVLHKFTDEISVLRARRQWNEVLEMVRSGEMPPDDEPQPTAAERASFVESV